MSVRPRANLKFAFNVLITRQQLLNMTFWLRFHWMCGMRVWVLSKNPIHIVNSVVDIIIGIDLSREIQKPMCSKSFSIIIYWQSNYCTDRIHNNNNNKIQVGCRSVLCISMANVSTAKLNYRHTTNRNNNMPHPFIHSFDCITIVNKPMQCHSPAEETREKLRERTSEREKKETVSRSHEQVRIDLT